MEARQRLREGRVNKPQKGNKNLYQIGQRVTLQNPKTQVWDIGAEVTKVRTAPDGKVVSYDLTQDNGNQTTRHRVFIRNALPVNVENHEVEAGVDDTDIVQPDDQAGAIPEPIHEPVSSRLRRRARLAILSNADLVEKSKESFLALTEASTSSLSYHLVPVALWNYLFLLRFVWSSSSKLIMTASSCSCTTILAVYSFFATILWVTLIILLGHGYGSTTDVTPIISANQGQVEIVNENTVNVDLFNSHASKSETIGNEKTMDDPCSQSCFHFFTSMEIGEIIACVLLVYLMLSNWTRISLFCHKKWIKMRKARNERETQAEAVKKAEEEERIQSLLLERLELQKVSPNPEQAQEIRVDIS